MSARALSVSELRKSAQQRLERNSHHVPFSSCVYWAGSFKEHGYGVIGVGRITLKAHRVAYALANDLPLRVFEPGDAVIRHTCDNPSCVNPDHLIPGTQLDNLYDTMSRDRLAFGSKHHGAKLNEGDIKTIVSLKGSATQAAIARRYGVAQSVISRIYSGRAWRRASKE
jgi:hypothetical protein